MPVAKTFVPLAFTSLTGNAATISFTSISSSYTDLTFVLLGRGDGSDQAIRYRLNDDATTDAYRARIWGATSGTNTNWAVEGSTSNSGLLGFMTSDSVTMLEFTLFDYRNTNVYKTLTGYGTYNGSRKTAVAMGATWKSTAAVTSIEFRTGSGNFTTDFSVTMYGILKA